jgi:hypothetical protein
MQIHEITQTPVTEGIGSALGGLVGKAQAGVQNLTHKLTGPGDYSAAKADPLRQQQVKMLADKTYRAWKSYEKDLLRSNPDARETGMYEQALMAFVNKNMLSGVYLPNLINQQQIRQLVAQLSQPTGVTEAEVVGAAKPGAPTAAEREQLQQKIQAATGNTKPVAQTQQPQPTAKTVASAPAPNEKDLWLKLVQQTAVAQNTAPGGKSSPASNTTQSASNSSNLDARSLAQNMRQQLPNELTGNFPAAGKLAQQLTGDLQVRSTGNAAADALLILMGFQGL